MRGEVSNLENERGAAALFNIARIQGRRKEMITSTAIG